jgi:hypothetical protein
MRRILELRITRWPTKLSYIVVLWLVGFPLRALCESVNIDALAANIVDSIVLLAGIFLAARIFRGKGEEIAPSRPWWQMTAWPKLSRRLGILASVSNAFALVYVILIATDTQWADRSDALSLGEWIASLVFYMIVGALYLNSAIRQTRAGVVAPVAAVVPSFKSPTKLS